MPVKEAINTYGRGYDFITIADKANHLWVRDANGNWVAFETYGHIITDSQISDMPVSAMRSYDDELMLAVDIDLCTIGA